MHSTNVQRQGHILVARGFRRAMARRSDPSEKLAIRESIVEVAKEFAKDNPRFPMERFFAYASRDSDKY